ncbi:flagellar protein [uncultured Vagococcus sp.]|uniref:flagellar protein n=1 Tax=uncultured Vagococcus sp. TaxID=189676 RepID=UPI0028D06A9A|nr:flagellar protein [uncultured Vagococcus sp.]
MGYQIYPVGQHNLPSIQSKAMGDFDQLLQGKLGNDGVKISQHAQKRMLERDIHLDENDKKALSQAVTEMISKGSRDCLIMYKETGFITSLPQRTIVTAIDHVELKEITNIDSVKFI